MEKGIGRLGWEQGAMGCGEGSGSVENLWNRGNTAGMEGFEVEWCGKLLFHVERFGGSRDKCVTVIRGIKADKSQQRKTMGSRAWILDLRADAVLFARLFYLVLILLITVTPFWVAGFLCSTWNI